MATHPREPIEFYACIDRDSCRPWMPDNVAYVLPASSFAAINFRRPNLPPHVRRVAADCGGYVATRIWGDYAFSPATYVDWLDRWPVQPAWAATMDYCCEPEIAKNPTEIRERQERTTSAAYYFWNTYADAPWAWVPTLQGWEVEDYLRHARDLAPLIREQQHVYYERPGMLYDQTDDPDPTLLAAHEANWRDYRVGIGTLCKRASAHQIEAIVTALASAMPGVRFHLWGVKLSSLWRTLPANVISLDSAAWNGRFGRDIELQRQSGLSQRRYAYEVQLPRYLARVDAALGQTRPPATPLP